MKKILTLLLFLILPKVLPAQPTITVNLSWTASTTVGVTAYNLYRLPVKSTVTTCPAFSSSYIQINSNPVAGTNYVDNPSAGTGYCYAATSLLGTQQSGPSNLVLVKHKT